MTSVQQVQTTNPPSDRSTPPPRGAVADPFLGLLARFAAGGREVAATAGSGLKPTSGKSRTLSTDAQSERENAQERLAQAVQIAQSHDLPPGLALATPRNITRQAVEKMTSPSEAASGHTQPNSPPTPQPGRASARRDTAVSVTPGHEPAPSAADQSAQSVHPQRANRPTAGEAPGSRPTGQAAPPVTAPGVTGQAGSRMASATTSVGRAHAPLTGPGTRAPNGAAALRGLAGTVSRSGYTKVARAAAAQPAERAPMPQVVRGLALALKQGGGRVTLRLNPDHLGSVVINVRVEGSKVAARLETSGDAAHRLLRDSLDGLRSALEARGLSVERIELAPPPTPDSSPREHRFGSSPGDAGSGGNQGAERHAERDVGSGSGGSLEGLDEPASVVSWTLPSSVRITLGAPGDRPRLEAVA